MPIKDFIFSFIATLMITLGLLVSPVAMAQPQGSVANQSGVAHLQTTSATRTGTQVAAKKPHRAKHPLILFWIMLSLFIIASLGGLILVGGLIILDNPLVTRIGGFILIAAIPLAFVCLAIGYLIE